MSPSFPASPGIPQPGRGTGATLTAAEGPGTSVVFSVSLSPLCNGTAGFLGGASEDCVSRVPRRSWPQTSPWPARCPQRGFQEDGKPQLPGSHALSETTPAQNPHLLEPRLPEVTQTEAMPPGSPQWGSR